MALNNRHKIIVGVDYGTTFTGEIPCFLVRRLSAKALEALLLSAPPRSTSVTLSSSSPGPARLVIRRLF